MIHRILTLTGMLCLSSLALATDEAPTRGVDATDTEVAPKLKPITVPPPTCYISFTEPTSQKRNTKVTLKMTTYGSIDAAYLDALEVGKTGGSKDVFPFNALEPLDKMQTKEFQQMYMGSVAGPGGSSTCLVNIAVIGDNLPAAPRCKLAKEKSSYKVKELVKLDVEYTGAINEYFLNGELNSKIKNGIEFEAKSTGSTVVTVWGPGGITSCSVFVAVTP